MDWACIYLVKSLNVFPVCCLVWFFRSQACWVPELTAKENCIEVIVNKSSAAWGNKHKICCVTDDLKDFPSTQYVLFMIILSVFTSPMYLFWKIHPFLLSAYSGWSLCPYCGCKSIYFSYSCFTCCCTHICSFISIYHLQLLKYIFCLVCLDQKWIQSNAQRTWCSEIYVAVFSKQT